MHRVIHFDIPTNNPKGCMHFYENVFGWKFCQWNEKPYWLAKTGEDDIPGINGAIRRKKSDREAVMNAIQTNDLEKIIENIERNQGELVAPKSPIKGIGWMILFKDPEDNLFRVIEPDTNAR